MDHTPELAQPALTLREQRRQALRAATAKQPVPLSVWLTEPLAGCCPTCQDPTGTACAQRLPLSLVRQITEAFTQPGDLVYVPDAGNANPLIGPVSTGRKVLGYAHTPDQARRVHQRISQLPTEVASLAVLRNTPAPKLPTHSERIRARAALALLAPHHPTDPVELALLLDACARVLKPGGVTVITSRQQPGEDRAGQLTTRARAAGLVYLQHIAAIEASADDGRLVPAHTRTGHGPHCACTRPRPGQGGHALIHHDLLIYTK